MKDARLFFADNDNLLYEICTKNVTGYFWKDKKVDLIEYSEDCKYSDQSNSESVESLQIKKTIIWSLNLLIWPKMYSFLFDGDGGRKNFNKTKVEKNLLQEVI